MVKDFLINKRNFSLLVFFIFTGIVYFRNLSVDILGGDIGDLATAAATAGIPHPPGYPLFTFLGFLLSLIPFSIPVISKIGLVSLISSLFTLFFFFQVCFRLSKNFYLSFLSTAILAYSYLFWFYSIVPEVFALNSLFAVIILYLTILLFETERVKYFYILIFVVTLSLTHHQTIILILPSVFYLLNKKWITFIKRSNKLILLGSFFLGLSPFIYIPIAALKGPPISWDNAVNLENFIRLVLRLDYGGFFSPGAVHFSSAYLRFLSMDHFVNVVISSVSLPACLFSFLGVIYLIRKKRKITISLLVAFVFSGPLFNFYAGFTISSFYSAGVTERFVIMPMIILLLFFPLGVIYFVEVLHRIIPRTKISWLIASTFIIIPMILFRANLVQTDLSHTKMGENLGRDVLAHLPKKSAIFPIGDTFTFNTWYVHDVLNYRADVFVVHFASRPKTTSRLASIYGGKNDQLETHNETRTMSQLKKRGIAVYTSDPAIYPVKNMFWIPEGLMFRLYEKKEIPSKEKYLAETKKIWENFHIKSRSDLALSERNLLTTTIPSIYSQALTVNALFIKNNYGDTRAALDLIKFALQIDDTQALTNSAYGSTLHANGNCKEAKPYLDRALQLEPNEKFHYSYLYFFYEKCGKNKQQQDWLKDVYYKKFKGNIIQDVKSIDKAYKGKI